MKQQLSPSPGMGLASLIGQCQVGAAPFTLFSASRGADAGGRRGLRRKAEGTHQLEDVLVPGHNGEFQSIIATEIGQGVRPSRGHRVWENRDPGRQGTPGAKGMGVQGLSERAELLWAKRGKGAHLFWIRAMTWE